MQGDPASTLLTDPEKLGLIAYLTVTIVLFLRGTIMTTTMHERMVAQLRADYEDRLRAERERTTEWKQLAQRTAYVAVETVDLAKKAV